MLPPLTPETDWKLSGFVRAIESTGNREELAVAMADAIELTRLRVEIAPMLSTSIDEGTILEWQRLIGTIEVAIKSYRTLSELKEFSTAAMSTLLGIEQHIYALMKRDLDRGFNSVMGLVAERRGVDLRSTVPVGQHPDEWLLDPLPLDPLLENQDLSDVFDGFYGEFD